jgi:outer membrane protein assembly factor BamB
MLVGELGLEPGPELQRLQQAILGHDSSLDAPAAGRSPPGRRRLLLAGAGASLVVIAAIAAAIMLLRDNGGGNEAVVTPGEGSVVALDASSGKAQRRVSLGRTPSAITARDGVVWLVDADAQTVLRLAEPSRVVETLSTGATPTDIAVGGGSVWVANGRPLEGAQFVGPVATAVARLDPTTGTERADIKLPRRGGAVSNLVENHLAVKGDAVWAVAPDFSVVRIDTATGAITVRSTAVRAAAVAAGPAGLWVLGDDGSVARLDEDTGQPVARARIPDYSVGSIAVGADAVWVTSPAGGTLWRIDGGRKPTWARSSSTTASRTWPSGPRRLGRQPARGHGREGRP